MKFLNFDRILCLAPHPDDVEYSMAGTILKYSDTHFDILCLTEGGYCDQTTSQLRHSEVQNAWNTTDSTNYNLFFSDVHVFRERGLDEWIKYIEDEFTSKYDYDSIITTSDSDSHHEHISVSSLAAPLSRVKPYCLIQYKSPSTLDSWVPNFFVNIDDVYHIKYQMVQEFKSQIDKPYFNQKIFEQFHMNFQCQKKGAGVVESYKITTLYK